jgi:hypothetical protein
VEGPITVSEPDNPHALVFRHMAARIWEKVAGEGSPAPPAAAHRTIRDVADGIYAPRHQG